MSAAPMTMYATPRFTACCNWMVRMPSTMANALTATNIRMAVVKWTCSR